MKKCQRGISLFLVCLFFLNTTAFAVDMTTKSSSYIAGTNAYITPEHNGLLVITFSISAYGEMSEIGATSIELYEDNGSSTKRVATYKHTNPDYSFIMGSKEWVHAKDIFYNGTVGYKYYAIVHLKASDSFGGDTVTEVTSMVTAKT